MDYLENVDVSSFDTGNVTNMYCMFRNCKNLKKLDMSGFDTSNVTDIGSMLDFCAVLSFIKTPKKMAADQSIMLPMALTDSKNLK